MVTSFIFVYTCDNVGHRLKTNNWKQQFPFFHHYLLKKLLFFFLGVFEVMETMMND